MAKRGEKGDGGGRRIPLFGNTMYVVTAKRRCTVPEHNGQLGRKIGDEEGKIL